MKEFIKTEEEIRQLRANIFGECSDKNWNSCKKNWMDILSVRWLLDNQPDKVKLQIEELKKHMR